jgi:hypothetical protein
MLEKSGRNYLVVASNPPATATRGKTFQYIPSVKSKKGGVKLKLEAGPVGMKLMPGGKLTWDVPNNYPEQEVQVILTVSDASGQECFHSFKLEVTHQVADPPAGKATPPEPKVEKSRVRPDLPAVRVELAPDKATPSPLAGIKPPILEQDKVIRQLPGSIGDVAIGGSGRYLILSLPEQRQLGVFDVNEAKIVKYLPVADDNVKFAAGREKMLVLFPDKNVLQRWNLGSFEKELTVPLPFKGVVKAVGMGSGSEGPLLLHWASGTSALDRASYTFLDIHTLKALDVNLEGGPRNTHYRDYVHIRASPDGKGFGMWCTSHSPSGLEALVLTGRTGKVFYNHSSVGHVVPGSEGSTLFTGAGLYTTSQVRLVGTEAREQRGVSCLPSSDGRYYLSLRPSGPVPRPVGNQPVGLTVHLMGDSRPLIQLNNVELATGDDQWAKHDFTSDKRVHLIPDAKLIITIPSTNDRLILHRFDIDEALEKAGINYLLVTSQPPLIAKKGATLTYQVTAKSKKGGVKLKLEAGPPGMRLMPGGKLTWDVPNNYPEKEVQVILIVTDASGQECFHSFKLGVD